MSNKVRVYELAKELQLETKDILSLCEDLSIAVKNHSSTMVDVEADKVRAVAGNAAKPPKLEAPKLEVKVSDKKNPSSASPKDGAKDPDSSKSKQQILLVSKPQSDQAQSVIAQGEVPQVNGVDQRQLEPALEILPPPAKTVARIEVKPEVQKSQLEAKPSPASDPTGVVGINPPAKLELIAPKPLQPVEVKTEPKPEIKPEIKPEPEPIRPAKVAAKPHPEAELLKPAKRPQPKPQTIVNVVPPTRPEASEPKPDRSELRPSRPPIEKPKAPNRVIGVAPELKPKLVPPASKPRLVKDAVLLERGITAPTETPHVLRPPTPPTRSLIAPPERKERSSEPKPSDGAELATPDLLILKDRPLQPRIAKKKTKKEDDEQDVLELKEKAAKLKPKRYLQVVDDEEEDILDEEGLEDSAAAALSLSTARPSARPKTKLSKPTVTVAGKAKRTNFRDRRNQPVEVVPEKPTKIVLQDSIKVHELASELLLPETDIIRVLFMKGMMASINQTLDIPTASMVATELGYEVEVTQAEAPARKVTEMLDLEDLDNLQRRPPVVTIMGHVDHGKTTLLDRIRKSKVAQGEAGGITQHIGAYHVNVEHEGQSQQIVFLDTPGHQAFTAMRARGTRVTDVAILVVAADDGVQPQTIEAISHAKAAKVPIIVAINKVDKYEAQPDRIRQELTEYGLLDEAWGGDTVMVPVSALTGDNIDTLLEMILLVTEVEDLTANPDRPAKGTVIEANLDKARGPVATFLIQNGTLRVGDVFVAGSVFGKVRAMIDDQGKRVEAATPSFAVEVLGINEVPAAGDEFEVFTDERQARAIASERAVLQRQSRLQQSMASRRISLATVSAKAQEGELKELNLILKADVQGSIEAILNALGQLPQEEVQVRVLLAAPGEITENDIDLAAASEAIVVGFNTTMATGARQSADQQGIDVRDYNIIYKLLEDVQGAMEGMLEPELVEEPLGQAEVRAVFTVGKGEVAGCYVLTGKLVRNCRVRIRRGKEVVHEAALDSLKRMKEDAKEVATGFECGVGLPKFSGWQQGDLIEAFRMVTKRRTLASV
ncbi:MAG: translation initiation factor IF-2 [Pseudanabaenaceae cyanobacterium bins.68]|nr:translation initiation factor IF-2 [Pseudanabaenaceae cyanobacterium bins.68]